MAEQLSITLKNEFCKKRGVGYLFSILKRVGSMAANRINIVLLVLYCYIVDMASIAQRRVDG